MSDTHGEHQAHLLAYLQARPGQEFSATGLGHLVQHPKYVGRALTTDHHNPRPEIEDALAENAIPGVRIHFYRNLDGILKDAAWWYSWVGIQP